MEDILLDTGASTTLVRQDLAPMEKKMDGKVSICCVHGDIVTYPLAEIEIEIEIDVAGRRIPVQAAIVDKLQVSVFVGERYSRVCRSLLDEESDLDSASEEAKEALVVTRAQKKRAEQKAAVLVEKEKQGGARLNAVEGEEPQSRKLTSELGGSGNISTVEEPYPGRRLQKTCFVGGRERPRLTRREKRRNR